MDIRLTRLNAIRTTEVVHIETTWDRLVEVIGTSVECPSDEFRRASPLFTGWELKQEQEGAKVTTTDSGYTFYSRCRENCVALHFLTLDIDNDPLKSSAVMTFEGAVQKLQGLEALLYTSYNHQNPDKHGGVDKFRALIPLLAPIPLEEYLKKVSNLRLLFPWAARESFTPSQPFWPAMHAPERANLVDVRMLTGIPFDINLVPDGEPESMSALNPAEHVDDDEEAALISITSAQTGKHPGLTSSALTWYKRLQPGYEHRQACYSFHRPETNHTAFMFRDGVFLIHQDMGLQKRTLIRCVTSPGKLRLKKYAKSSQTS